MHTPVHTQTAQILTESHMQAGGVLNLLCCEKVRSLSVCVRLCQLYSPMLLFNALGHTGLCRVGSSWQYALMPSIFSLRCRAILGPSEPLEVIHKQNGFSFQKYGPAMFSEVKGKWLGVVLLSHIIFCHERVANVEFSFIYLLCYLSAAGDKLVLQGWG